MRRDVNWQADTVEDLLVEVCLEDIGILGVCLGEAEIAAMVVPALPSSLSCMPIHLAHSAALPLMVGASAAPALIQVALATLDRNMPAPSRPSREYMFNEFGGSFVAHTGTTRSTISG